MSLDKQANYVTILRLGWRNCYFLGKIIVGGVGLLCCIAEYTQIKHFKSNLIIIYSLFVVYFEKIRTLEKF